MNVIDYITITRNLKNVRLQITFDYMKNVIDYNGLRLQITITPCLPKVICHIGFPIGIKKIKKKLKNPQHGTVLGWNTSSRVVS
jgi:hypothetical protein